MKNFVKNNLLHIVVITFLLLTLGIGIYFLAPSSPVNETSAGHSTLNITLRALWANTNSSLYSSHKSGTYTSQSGNYHFNAPGTLNISVSSSDSGSTSYSGSSSVSTASGSGTYKVDNNKWSGGIDLTLTFSSVAAQGFIGYQPYIIYSGSSSSWTYPSYVALTTGSTTTTTTYTLSHSIFDGSKQVYMCFMAIYHPMYISYSFDSQGGSSVSTRGGYYYDNYSLPSDPTRTGYMFNGWYRFGNIVTNSSTIDYAADHTLVARWTKESYTINFNANGGSVSGSPKSVSYGDTFNLPTPSRTGHVFTGWTYNGSTYSAGQSYTVPDYGGNGTSVTFTANWRAERYDVIYVKGNGENNSTGSVNYGSSLSLLSAPSRTGYSFTGWVCDRGGTYSAGASYSPGAYGDNADITFTAQWTPRTDYRININLLHPNGSESGSRGTFNLRLDTGQTLTGLTDQPSNTMTFGTSWTISNISPATGMHISNVSHSGGGSFSGSGSGPYTLTGNFTSNPSGNWDATITIQMAWNTYTIAYNGNGATGGSTASTAMTYNTAKNLTKNGFTRPGYVFLYWTDSSGNRYYDEQSVNNLTATHGGTVTLYAQWQATWATQASRPSGSGTVASPYRITSANELAWLASQNNSFSGQRFELMNDINLSSSTYKWLPIGSTTAFQGIFDGNGFTISGFQTTDTKHSNNKYLYSNQGLFGQTNGATIQNLHISNATVYGNANVGIIVGSVSSATTVKGCVIENSTVTASSTNGMIIGNNAGSISNCLVKSSNATTRSLGGGSQTSCLYDINGTRSQTSSFDLSAWGKVGTELLPGDYSWSAGASSITQTDINDWINRRIG